MGQNQRLLANTARVALSDAKTTLKAMGENFLENYNKGFLKKVDSVSRFLYRKKPHYCSESAEDFNLYRPIDIYYTG